MKRFVLFVLLALVIVANENVYAESECMPMFRLYNPNSGEHFYTADINERTKLLHLGWSYEGVGWFASNNTHTRISLGQCKRWRTPFYLQQGRT